MSAEPRPGSAAPLFAALGDPTRLALVERLSQGAPLSISRLTEGTVVTRQAITKHLRILQAAGLVRRTPRGRETHYQLDPAPIDDARRALDRVSRLWDQALERLRTFVEQAPPDSESG